MAMRSLIAGYFCRAMLKGRNSAKCFKNYSRIILSLPRIEFSIKNDRFLKLHIDIERSDLFICIVCLWNVFDFVKCYSQDISYSYFCKISLRTVEFQRDSHKIFISFLKTAFKNIYGLSWVTNKDFNDILTLFSCDWKKSRIWTKKTTFLLYFVPTSLLGLCLNLVKIKKMITRKRNFTFKLISRKLTSIKIFIWSLVIKSANAKTAQVCVARWRLIIFSLRKDRYQIVRRSRKRDTLPGRYAFIFTRYFHNHKMCSSCSYKLWYKHLWNIHK